MPKFRMRAPRFDAFQWTGDPTQHFPEWFGEMISEGEVEFSNDPPIRGGKYWMRVLPPTMPRNARPAYPGSWIVRPEPEVCISIVDNDRFREEYERIL